MHFIVMLSLISIFLNLKLYRYFDIFSIDLPKYYDSWINPFKIEKRIIFQNCPWPHSDKLFIKTPLYQQLVDLIASNYSLQLVVGGSRGSGKTSLFANVIATKLNGVLPIRIYSSLKYNELYDMIADLIGYNNKKKKLDDESLSNILISTTKLARETYGFSSEWLPTIAIEIAEGISDDIAYNIFSITKKMCSYKKCCNSFIVVHDQASVNIAREYPNSFMWVDSLNEDHANELYDKLNFLTYGNETIYQSLDNNTVCSSNYTIRKKFFSSIGTNALDLKAFYYSTRDNRESVDEYIKSRQLHCKASMSKLFKSKYGDDFIDVARSILNSTSKSVTPLELFQKNNSIYAKNTEDEVAKMSGISFNYNRDIYHFDSLCYELMAKEVLEALN